MHLIESSNKHSNMFVVAACPTDVAVTLWFMPREERTARELKALPLEEREQVWADLSGKDLPRHYRRMLERKRKPIPELMAALDNEINQQENISIGNGYADYLQGVSCQELELIELAFLRLYRWDVSAAAKHLLNHVTEQQRLFRGNEISTSMPLSREYGQVLRQPERGGRQVLLLRLDRLLQLDVDDAVSF